MFDAPPPLDPEGDNPFWLFGTPAERLETVLSMTPSDATWQALLMIGRCTLEPAERVLLATAWDRQLAAANAHMHAAVSQAAKPEPGPLGDVDAELGLMLRRSEQGMEALKRFANRLVREFPVMFSLLEAGKSGISYARALDDGVYGLTDEQVAEIDERVSPRAATLTLPAFRRALARAVAAADPDNAEKRHARARKEESGAKLIKKPDGMAMLGITMSAPAAIAAVGALNQKAKELRTPDDPRTHGERQVDAFLDALAISGGAAGGDGASATEPRQPKKGHRCGAQIVAFIDLLSLLGLRNNPGELAGYGPISAAQVRELLLQNGTTLHRLVTDPITGVVKDYSVEGYVADDTLRQLLEMRDVTCRYPGCTRNAIWCDTEHCDPYDEGGATSCANCGLMCRRHHNRKTHDGFRYCRPDPATGETVWTTPLGFVHRQGPAFYYRDGRDTGDTTLVRIPTGNGWKERFDAEDDPPPD